jgi:hypothetical protein
VPGDRLICDCAFCRAISAGFRTCHTQTCGAAPTNHKSNNQPIANEPIINRLSSFVYRQSQLVHQSSQIE